MEPESDRFFLYFINEDGTRSFRKRSHGERSRERDGYGSSPKEKQAALERALEFGYVITDGIDGPVVWPIEKIDPPQISEGTLFASGFFQWEVTIRGFAGWKCYQFNRLSDATKFMRESLRDRRWDACRIDRLVAYTIDPSSGSEGEGEAPGNADQSADS